MPVQMWALRLDRALTEHEYETLLALLPPARRTRLMRQPPEKHGEVLCAYGLLLALLRSRYGWQTLPPMETDARGKPFFPAYPGVCFSLSHTEGAAAAAVSGAPVGVDVQCLQPVRPSLMGRLGAETPETFWNRWVLLEARGKRQGDGIWAQLRRGLPPTAADAVFPVFPGFRAGVSAAEPVTADAVRRLRTAELLPLLAP